MQALSFVADANLDFPSQDSGWAKFFADQGCSVGSTADLDRLTADLKAHKLSAAYLPAANAFVLRNDATYTGLASALSGQNGRNSLSSYLTVRRDSPAKTVEDLKGKRLGRINAYCTTSYFAPAIYLNRNGFSILNFFSDILDVGAWQKQIDAVVAKTVDATMVDSDTWHGKPENAENTRVIGVVDELPTPIVLVRSDAPPEFVAALHRQLLAERRDTTSLFSGFVAYERQMAEKFFGEAAAAFAPPSAARAPSPSAAPPA